MITNRSTSKYCSTYLVQCDMWQVHTIYTELLLAAAVLLLLFCLLACFCTAACVSASPDGIGEGLPDEAQDLVRTARGHEMTKSSRLYKHRERNGIDCFFIYISHSQHSSSD